MSKTKVLVFPAGEINAIEIHDALSTCVNIELIGAASIDRHGEYVFKNYISGVPKINEPNFISDFNYILDSYKVDVVFPTHDTVAMFFAENREKIHAKIIVADKETSEVCRDKKKIYDLFQKERFCPRNYKTIENYPVFIKPREGQGGVGAKLIRKKEDIPDIDLKEFVICEYLPGREYTVDCFTDRHGALRAFLPRTRDRLLAGVTVSSVNIELTDDICIMAETINSKLKFRGLWWFQVKEDVNGEKKLLEISTRCAGTMCMARAKGVNLPLLSVYDALDKEISVEPNTYNLKMDRTLISRYKTDFEYDTVYFDFDDTLIIDGKVHLPAIAFLYQCKNQGKKVILLTQHETDIYEDIRKNNICESLFDEIINIDLNASKADYIKQRNSILVDNAYKCRNEVQKKCNIPVFDVDMLEVLEDWRW